MASLFDRPLPSSSAQCRGFVKEHNGFRPCRKSGNEVLANGYCRQHQYFAVLKTMEKLKVAEIEISKLEQRQDGTADPRKLELLRKQIAMMNQELEGAKRLCSEDSDCSSHLRDLLVTLRDVTAPMNGKAAPVMPHEKDQHPITKLRQLEHEMNTLAVGTSPEDAQAFEVSKEYELSRRRDIENNAEIAKLQNDLHENSSLAQRQEVKFQRGLQTLTNELKETESRHLQAQQVINSLEQRLDRCAAESKQVSGVYSDTINRLQQDVQKYKDLYNNMVGREIRVGKSVDQLTKNERQLQKALEELKQNYERKIAKMRNDFAENSRAGGTVLSERESALTQEVERLKSDLEMALSDLKMATQAGKEAINRATSVNMPYGQVAQELATVNDMLRAKNKELSQLQGLYDRKTSEFAQSELRTAQKIEQATAQDRAEVQRLSNELATTERKLASAQQEMVSLQSRSYELKRQQQNEMQRLNNQLRDTRNQLMQVKQQRESEKRNLEQQYRMLKNRENSNTMEADFKYNQLKETLNAQYMAKAQQLQDQFEANKLALEQERRNLQIAQKQAQETSQLMSKQRGDLERYRSAYEQKMSEFLGQKDALNTSLSQAREQANQFAEIENDYKKRIDILRQTVAVQRQRYEARINQLNTKLQQAIVNRNQIINSLEKCNASRDAIVAKVNMLTDENTRLKDMFLQVKSQMDIMRTKYNAHLEKLRADAGKMQSDIRTCSQRLQDATLAHDDVKRMKNQAQQLRINLEQTIRAAQGNEQALRRLLKDRELEKQQVIRLQSALKDCSVQRSQSQVGLENTNAELRDVKQMQGTLTHQIQGMTQDFQRALEEREANMARETMEQQVREQNLQQELAQFKLRTGEQQRRISSLSQQKLAIEDSLADAEVGRAHQIQMLLDAQRMAGQDPTGGYGGVTGKSSLVET